MKWANEALKKRLAQEGANQEPRYGPGTSLAHEQGQCLPNCGYCHNERESVEPSKPSAPQAEAPTPCEMCHGVDGRCPYCQGEGCCPYKARLEANSAPSNIEQEARELAQFFHETYERLAPDFGYATRPESAQPWKLVPTRNKELMVAVCKEVLAFHRHMLSKEK